MFCGATHIRQHWFLTAAHCLEWNFGVNPKSSELGKQNRIKVFMGMKNAEQALQKRLSTNLIMHPKYIRSINTYNGTYYDIGLLRVEKPFTIGTKIKIARIGKYVSVGTKVVTVGYGMMEDNQLSQKLQFITLNITQIDKTILICANSEGKNICTGDSGGPMYWRKSILVGVVSTSYKECSNGIGIYTSVPAFNTWIMRITKAKLTRRAGASASTIKNPKHLDIGTLLYSVVYAVYYRAFLLIK
ncbi:hypothetical protein Trydic_g1282 [Trypoxylus dichotomus]